MRSRHSLIVRWLRLLLACGAFAAGGVEVASAPAPESAYVLRVGAPAAAQRREPRSRTTLLAASAVRAVTLPRSLGDTPRCPVEPPPPRVPVYLTCRALLI